MPFKLFNAPVTFQSCMMSKFFVMGTDTIDVFMDDFYKVGDSLIHMWIIFPRYLKGVKTTSWY